MTESRENRIKRLRNEMIALNGKRDQLIKEEKAKSARRSTMRREHPRRDVKLLVQLRQIEEEIAKRARELTALEGS